MEENFELLEGYQFNLSDFALFLSVMKDPRAYRCVLSVFMDEPDIELQDVKVEQVVLDKSGKRAIRLDAWAKSVDSGCCWPWNSAGTMHLRWLTAPANSACC